MSMTFNPCEMDYPWWLTISGFVMTILIFFMTHIFAGLSGNYKNIADVFSYFTTCGYIVMVLFFITSAGIFCFIIN